MSTIREATAHIITADPVALGDPAVIILTRDEGMGATVVETHPIEVHLGDARGVLFAYGWEPVGDPVEIETGYWTVNVIHD